MNNALIKKILVVAIIASIIFGLIVSQVLSRQVDMNQRQNQISFLETALENQKKVNKFTVNTARFKLDIVRNQNNISYAYNYNIESKPNLKVIQVENDTYVYENEQWYKLNLQQNASTELIVKTFELQLESLLNVIKSTNENSSNIIHYEYNGTKACNNTKCYEFTYNVYIELFKKDGITQDATKSTLLLNSNSGLIERYLSWGEEFSFNYHDVTITVPSTFIEINREESDRMMQEIIKAIQQ